MWGPRRVALRGTACVSVVSRAAICSPSPSSNASTSFARVMTAGRRLILLDEVLSGLNSEEVEQGIALARWIADQGIAILMIEHIVRAIAELADRVVILDRGEKIVDGPVAAVLNDRHALNSYFGLRRARRRSIE